MRLFIEFLIKLAVIAASVWVLLTFVIGLTIHYGNNMFPSIRDGDLVVAYRLQRPYLNGAVMYKRDGRVCVGRVVGMPGNEIDISDIGALTVNGIIPAEEVFYPTYQSEDDPITIVVGAPGAYFGGEVTYTKIVQGGASVTGTVEFIAGRADIALKHGEQITIDDLPGGMQFTVTEKAEDAAGYTTTWSVNAAASETGREAAGTMANNPRVTFTNDREVLIPSGVFDATFKMYAAIPVLLLGMTLAKKRRREDED